MIDYLYMNLLIKVYYGKEIKKVLGRLEGTNT